MLSMFQVRVQRDQGLWLMSLPKSVGPWCSWLVGPSASPDGICASCRTSPACFFGDTRQISMGSCNGTEAWAAVMVHKYGREELPHVRGQGQGLGGPTLCPRPGAAAERSNPMSKERRLRGRRRAERSYSTFKVRRGDLVQGKEQRLHFAGTAVKRYPTSKVRETQVRW